MKMYQYALAVAQEVVVQHELHIEGSQGSVTAEFQVLYDQEPGDSENLVSDFQMMGADARFDHIFSLTRPLAIVHFASACSACLGPDFRHCWLRLPPNLPINPLCAARAQPLLIFQPAV